MDKKVMIITGGSNDLGKVCVEYFMKEYQVVILSRSCDNIKQLIDNTFISRIACNISDAHNVQHAVSEIIDTFGHIVLINNAGFWIQGKLTDCDDKTIKITLEVNLLGQIYMTKYYIPRLEQTKGIVNINYQSGLYKKEERSVYHLSKRGMTGFVKAYLINYNRFESEFLIFTQQGLIHDCLRNNE